MLILGGIEGRKRLSLSIILLGERLPDEILIHMKLKLFVFLFLPNSIYLLVKLTFNKNKKINKLTFHQYNGKLIMY